MKITLYTVILILVTLNLLAQTKQIKLKVYAGATGIEIFSTNQIAPIHGFMKKGGTFIGEFDSENIEKMNKAGIKYDILIDDLQAFYKSHNGNVEKAVTFNSCFDRAKDYPQPTGVQKGSMGGFYTYSEAMAELDTMISLYPNLISSKTLLGNSFEGRAIYFLKISDNPGIQENEPQVMYTAIHHAQEPASLHQLIYFMYYLLENYGTDPEVTYLVDNTELYFIPVVNPDGFVYNEQQNPNGGGTHRKNRHTSLFSDGVDLNRNYATYFDYDEIGSSSIGFHPWYRGDAAFSEPESQATKSFMESHNIIIDVNWHAYGNMIIYPWNYENHYTDDSLQFVSLSESMAYQNNYRFGTVYETYGYQSNGDADDWGYGETGTKISSLSITAEVGNSDDSFWPDTSRIMPLCEGTVWTNLVIAHFAHAYYKITDRSSQLIEEAIGYLPFNIQSIGLEHPASFTVTFLPLTPNISFPNPVLQFNNMGLMQNEIDSVGYVITAGQGDVFSYIITVNNGLYTFRDTIQKVFGNNVEIISDNCETMQNWTGDDWNITGTQYYSGSHAMTESPGGNYTILQSSTLNLTPAIDLSAAQHAVVQFMMKYDLENNYDYVQVMASSDGGSNWQPLCGRLSKLGTDDEDEGQPVYHGQTPEWSFEEISLDDYIGESIQLKFYFYSDQSVTRDGFYFDNFKVIVMDTLTIHANRIPTEENTISLSPNPAHDEIMVETNLLNSRLEIFNVLGKKVYGAQISDNQFKINISQWNKGVYLYRVTGNNCEKGKFVVY
jgi:hypothetical protein